MVQLKPAKEILNRLRNLQFDFLQKVDIFESLFFISVMPDRCPGRKQKNLLKGAIWFHPLTDFLNFPALLKTA